MTVLLTFYSYPVEASITAIVRGIEVVNPDRVIIVSSRRRCPELENVVEVLRKSYEQYNIEFIPKCVVPDVESSVEEIPKVIDVMKNLLNEVDDVVYFVASSGSRLEIASLSMVIDRARTEVLYISFLWGPWKGVFYPYTPKPLELVHEVHPVGKGFAFGPLPDDKTLAQLLDPSLPRLRRSTLLEQYVLNKHCVDSLCIATRDGIDCSCRGMEIEIFHGTIRKLSITVDNYCNPRHVVEAVSNLCKEILELEGKVPNEVHDTLLLLARASGICMLCVDEYEHDDQLKNVVLIDVVRRLGRSVAIDTNVMYFGLHSQIYEDPEVFRRCLTVPLCLYLEAYEHQAQGAKPYHKLRAAISSLLVEELNHWNFVRDDSACHKPCEVGLATASKGRYIVATGDIGAYQRLFRMIGVESILVTTKSINNVVFLQNEVSRRISYAYYALAQLRALTKSNEVSKALHGLDVSIEIRFR